MDSERQYIDRAKELLREQLAKHSDQGVRTLNDLAELPDDHPSVIKIAAALRARAQTPEVSNGNE